MCIFGSLAARSRRLRSGSTKAEVGRSAEHIPGFYREIKPRAVQLIAALNFILSHPLNRGRPLSTLGRFAAWQIASRLRTEIEFEWIGGRQTHRKPRHDGRYRQHL